jgi:uncharacterized protein with HEPN domain
LKDRAIFLSAALESVNRIEEYTEGYSLHRFLEDTKTQDAVIRNLEIVWQAVKDFGLEHLVKDLPAIPWRQIAGMRNVIAHEYLGVDSLLVWETVQTGLLPVKEALEKLLDRTE